MKSVVFTGCSFTAGNGWTDCDPKISVITEVKDCPDLWVNLCYKNIDTISQMELLNLAVGGSSNTEIFESTSKAIADYTSNIDTIFVQWTAMPRYNFNVGFESWDTQERLSAFENLSHDINLSNGDHYPRSYINDLLDRIRVMHHLHWEILKVVNYTNILTKIANCVGIKNIFFINGLCPWDKNYFVELNNTKPENYTPFTKTKILNLESRDDKDIHLLYKTAHSQYKSAGGINNSVWINLYNSFFDQTIDTNFDRVHPGTKSNQKFYQTIYTRLKNLNKAN
jgi:hypothetical protein